MSIIAPSNTEIKATSNLGRQYADYHPSLWNDYFLKYASDSLEVDDEMKKTIETLKEEVRKILVSMKEPIKKAEVIESIQCLGLSYHFEPEIDEMLKQIHNDYVENNEITHIEDLHSLALLFKLLRQHGYPVPPDVFNKLKDEKGNFRETLTSDVEGMITLYEACYLSIHGEDILDQALTFTTNHLRSITIESNPFPAAKLNNVLKQCPYRGTPRLEARKYISIYHLHPSCNEVLLTLAKLDFNALQKLHQKEIGNICKWDISCLDDLPGYMKLIYKELLKFYDEIDEDMRKEGRSYNVDYIIKDLKGIVQAQMTEARWFHRNYIPTTEEYFNLSMITTCHTSMSMSSFICMGNNVTEDIFKWAQNQPKIIKAASVIARFSNDIVSREFELKIENKTSIVECYMRDHGVSRQEAVDELKKMIKSAWKDMNEECLRPTQVPMPFLIRVLNLARFLEVLYKEDDSITHSGATMKENLALLFVDPVPI